ncbi:MAG: DNA protecting protein DprA [Alphaproteobacteria bacterium RIFCSPLOWO2_01_FULL_45_8]|nr:MAG: DNA protecting protein DprA [Alphaproteobacteria bacterium GWB1_45_5]OFW76243.1 MAG: DNA protecting protein DprA [Alphaproteobacteria bacterium GWA1_45_9]OFW89485.1 MAG: DNA protecting protein DprA [Alphaproteobacteria bacterium RIFCSPHIGHO2_01_FULL_41_14]OFW96510.1 MAG: DNA protecting protein DprA [Alphaproteobacteria bacterium RIFCSPLOWO2_01_FULL_45_8]HCI48854.1 DNA-protecting protein DprA [Holosporales bacterium]
MCMPLNVEQFSVLRLIRTHHIGPQTLWKLMAQFHSAASIVENWPEIQANMKRKIDLVSEKIVITEIEKTFKSEARFLFHSDPSYPASLHSVADRPPVLSFKGTLALLAQKKVAIVGARNASSHGCRLAYLMAKELGRFGWRTVSGLARGIDAAAHQGSLESGTIAVLGNGIQTIYPEENKKLYEEITEKGLLLSEFSFDTQPHMGNFPKRNRLISALVQGIVVVEAAHQSGSLLTAQYGLEMGKDIFAVPGSPMDPRCCGSNRLIKQGAVLTESAQDVLEILDQGQWVPHYKENREKKKKILASEKKNESSILDFLSTVPLSVDELADLTQLRMDQLSSLLTDLELEGQIMKHPGNKVSRVLQG